MDYQMKWEYWNIVISRYGDIRSVKRNLLIKNLLFLFFISLAFQLQAQDKRYWSDQKLVLSDFEGSPAGSVPFQIKYDIAYSTKKQQIERTSHVHYQARAIFIPSQSWIVHDSLQELRLRYCNVIFDFVELYARRFDDEINVTEHLEQSKMATIRALNDAVTQLASDTKMGTDRQRVAFWEKHIDSVLSNTFRKEIPDFRYDRMTIGYALGGAYNHLTGNLAAHFPSPVSFANVFFFGWKRMMYTAEVTYSGNLSPRKSYYSEKDEFGDTSKFVLAYQTLSVGYEIVKKPQFLLTPYAGLSTMRFSMPEGQANEKYRSPLKASVNVGLSMDFRSKAFYQNNHILLRYGLVVRGNYSPYNYLPKMSGNCISFTLGLSLYLDQVKNYL